MPRVAPQPGDPQPKTNPACDPPRPSIPPDRPLPTGDRGFFVGPPGPPGGVGPQGPPGSALTPFEFAFGVASPITAYTLASNALVTSVRLVITQPFDGVGASLSVGLPGQPEFFLAGNENDPTLVTSFEVYPNLEQPAGTQIVVTINPGAGASTGQATLVVELLGTV